MVLLQKTEISVLIFRVIYFSNMVVQLQPKASFEIG